MTAPAYIDHVTLTTGHRSCARRADVAAPVLDVVAPWLDRVLLADAPSAATPLPVPDLSDFSATAFTTPGGLVVTVYGPDILSLPPAMPEPIPLVTFGVARRSRGAAKLWDSLVKQDPTGRCGTMPGAPWLAVLLHPSLTIFPDAAHWLGDFERCVAWAWVERLAD